VAWVWIAHRPGWIRQHPSKVARSLWSGVFRVATLISVGYLVYDRLYETGASIETIASDPADPLLFPFSVTNNSHVFWMHQVKVACEYRSLLFEKNSHFVYDSYVSSSVPQEIPIGTALLYSCRGPTPKLALKSGELGISISYETNIMNLYRWVHANTTYPTKFTWYSAPTSARWIKGVLAR
jgi:hypothetical protein